jgi:predicted Zn-dependent protease
MVKYTPKELKDNPNVSPRSSLKELGTLLLGLLVIILGIYIALGAAVDFIVPRLPENIEENLGKFYSNLYQTKKIDTPLEHKCQQLLDSLVKYLPNKDKNKKYTIHIVESDEVNALALPGRNIVIFSALLKEISSENELAFVLAHELGHFAHKDHLRGLGRRLVFFVISSIFLGQDSSVSKFLGNSLVNAEMKFSQKQETEADLFAVDLLNKKYNHVGGSTVFLQKMKDKEKTPSFLYFFATHPHPANRLKTVKSNITRKKLTIGKIIPLDESIQQEIKQLTTCEKEIKNNNE